MDSFKIEAAVAAIKTLDGMGYTFDPRTETWDLETDVPLPKVTPSPIYKQRRIDGEMLRCYRCNSEAPTARVLGKHLRTIHEDEKEILLPICKFCFETELGVVLSNPHPPEVKQLVRGICQALNIVHWENKFGRLD